MLPTLTLLFVDDEELVRGYFEQLLTQSGWNVATVRSGTDALAALTERRFSIILCDLDLGAGLDGLDVFDRLPETSRGTPFIILTAHATSDRCRDAFRRGVKDFLQKPISTPQLLSALDRALGGTAVAQRTSEDDSTWTDKAGDHQVRRALRVIDREFSNAEFSVAALAKLIDLTPEHLARLFRVHLHRTPLRHIHETRIVASEKLLDNPRLSIHSIAFDCGFGTTTDFDGWFRRLRSVSPSEWRAGVRIR